jgi:hypothetical protein
MIGAYGSLAVLLVSAAVVGQALLALCAGTPRGAPRPLSPLAPALGLAAALVIAGAAVRLPGEGTTAAIALLLALLAATAFLRRRTRRPEGGWWPVAAIVAITVAAASLPFAVAGHVGILGAGLLNDDMASHLIIADHVRDPSGHVPTFVRGGYPIGPHALVVALSETLGTGLVEAFAALTLVLAPVTGLLALGLFGGLGQVRRVIACCLVALPYLGASYLAQGAFKEPLQALLLIGFAVILAGLVGMPSADAYPDPERRRRHPLWLVLPLGILAAASVFNYSLPGLLWIGAVGAAVLAARWWLVRPRPELPTDWPRRLAPYALGVMAIAALATVQEWGRIADFTRLDALNPDRFGSDLGNLQRPISPLEALGIWPTGDYRTSAEAAAGPAALFYAGGALALAALLAGVSSLARRGRWTLPAALAAIVVVWAVTALFSTPYIVAKALAIASPIVMAIAAGSLLSGRGAVRTAVAVLFVVAAAGSSFLALRQSPVRPEARSAELEQIRAAVHGEPVLFLGRDNFIAWELRGSDEITGIVTNHYSVEEVRGRFRRGEGGGEKFDVDAVFPATLDRFRFILAPRGGPSSTPPPRFEAVVETPSYVLWERHGRVGRRKTLDEGVAPGAVLDCTTPRGRQIARGRGTAQIWVERPVIEGADGWQPSADPTDRRPSHRTLELPAGRWLLSLEYDSRRDLTLRAPAIGLEEMVPANLDFRGPSPLFGVAEVELEEPTRLELEVSVAEPNPLGRLLRAPNEAHLRRIAATPQGAIERIPRREACGEYVDWFRAR